MPWQLRQNEICDALARGESVKLHGFGTFNVRRKRQRIGRDPRTGVEATISPRRVVTFKASPVLLAHVDAEASVDADRPKSAERSPDRRVPEIGRS